MSPRLPWKSLLLASLLLTTALSADSPGGDARNPGSDAQAKADGVLVTDGGPAVDPSAKTPLAASVGLPGKGRGVPGTSQSPVRRVGKPAPNQAAEDAPENAAPQALVHGSLLEEFWYNFRHNLFKPLLLFFYLGFLVPIFKVKLDFPVALYQGLTIYLLVAIGWHGGEELSQLPVATLRGAVGFMVVGFILNFIIGILAFLGLHFFTTLRSVDKATVAGYYGSDSAGTFVTCLGVLTTAHIAYDAYMPVMLAIMEIPGCLVALYLVSRLRNEGMDALGNMPHEAGYSPGARRPADPHDSEHGDPHGVEDEDALALQGENKGPDAGEIRQAKSSGLLSAKLLHEVFLNPGLYLLFGGIAIGYISGLQGREVTRPDDSFFVTLFHGVLCLFLLEMGMTASRKLRDLATAGPGFIAFGLIAPNVFATIGIATAHIYSVLTHTPLALGSYVLFAVLCGAASYIAVPAVQRLAIPEASPTLPLAASLGLTFSYNVTIGIPIYIMIAQALMRFFPG